MIRLIGPGGAGKTTTGAALADWLGGPFVDLDAEFTARHGNISTYLDAHGYDAYAEQNVTLYGALSGDWLATRVVALSSGFMTYRYDVHPRYKRWRQQVAVAAWTFVLLPSLDLEMCVADRSSPTTASHCQVSSMRRAGHSHTVPLYVNLPARKSGDDAACGRSGL